MKTKKSKIIFGVLIFAFIGFLSTSVFSQKKYTYESAPNDPMNCRIYKLDNGLTVYMSVYKDAPRIQTEIAVRTGSKNDPHDNTGLSHYLEHMMFKGTEKFGSKDYTKEKIYLDQIENLFEDYRITKDTLLRRKKYHVIDSVSGLAAKWAIANEYDKMIQAIGGKNSNAFTSLEQTVYISDVPANQLENWAKIESERFTDPVFRIFHTELEAVYEEKNMGLDSDGDKVWESLFAGLFQKHTYGTQTTIGTIEHLKNPSLKALRNYYNAKYVPNNMAIALSGDLDPDATIALIDKMFGTLRSKPLTVWVSPVEDPISKPIVKEVIGPDAEGVTLGFRMGGADTKDADLVSMMDMILANSTAGLIDLNLNQAQKVIGAGSFAYVNKDYSSHIFYANPKEGQKMEEVKDLLLSQIELIKKGEFPDWMLPAIINDLKLQQTKSFENNMQRTSKMLEAFIFEKPWKETVDRIDRLSKITKNEIVEFAKKNYGNNYVVVYKKTGEDKNVSKVSKPVITPVELDRESQSDFLKSISNSKVKEIEPVFVNYQEDIKNFKIKNNISVQYKENVENKTFALYYIFDMGKNNNKKLGLALNYLNYLGTAKLTPAQVKQEFYKVGCNFSVFSSEDQVWVNLSGLSENISKGLELFESVLADPKPNQEALDNYVNDILKQRDDAKLSKETILWNALFEYAMFGPKSTFTDVIPKKELKTIKADELISIIKSLNSYEHRVMYYGTHKQDELTTILNKYHNVPAQFKPIPAAVTYTEQDNPQTNVYVVDYDMKQVEIMMMSKSEKFNKENIPLIKLYNEYFGGGMASIVFQELRESRALAYSAMSRYRLADKKEKFNFNMAYIGTQNDKLPEAMKGMTELLNNMPQADKALSAAQDAVIKQIRADRITKTRVLFEYENVKKLGCDYDLRKDVFAKVPGYKFADVKAFQEKYVKNKNYNIMILGKKDQLDIKTLEKYGKVTYLTLEQIFGY